MDTGIQLGRRFRALKLWMILRHFGAEGLRAHLAEHMRLARLFASWVDASDRFERAAPVPFSVVCFRLRGGGDATRTNARVLDAVNAPARFSLAHEARRRATCCASRSATCTRAERTSRARGNC